MANVSAFTGAMPVIPGGTVEMGYLERTSNLSLSTGISPATAELVIGSISAVCDGSPVEIEFFASDCTPTSGSGNYLVFSLYVDGVQHTQVWGFFSNPAGSSDYKPVFLKRRIVPSAGVHTFAVRAYSVAAGGFIEMRPGGADRAPGFLRVSKIVNQNDGLKPFWTPPIVTQLPSQATVGDQVLYAADATNGVYWHLQYDGLGTYPWKFIGGSPIYSENTGSQAYTITAGNYQDWVTRSVPLAGDYTAEGSCGLTTTTGNDTIVVITPSAARATTYQLCRQSNGASQYEKGYTKARFPAIAASATLAVSLYSVAAGTGATLNNGTLHVTPIRVSA